MAKRKLSKESRFERLFYILEYLKYNTDKAHPTSPYIMREDEELSAIMGDKETFNRLIKDMAYVLNGGKDNYEKVCSRNDEGLTYQNDKLKLYFKDFDKYIDDYLQWLDSEESDSDEEAEKYKYTNVPMRLAGLYYNRTFSYEDINNLIEGVLATKTLDSKAAEELIQKIEKNLTTKYYKNGHRHICKVREPELIDREQMKTNLITLQRAIDQGVKVAFQFNGYTCHKSLAPAKAEKDIVSPYYIVANGGRYYLLACKEITVKGKLIRNMSIWRIDLMTEIEIPGVNEKLGIPGIARLPKRQVSNLPLEWSEEFQLEHLNMSYDEPVLITLRIKSLKKNDNSDKRTRADYTFMHDWFGNNFKYIRTEKEPPYDDIVEVRCSPFAMSHWALQYCDRVEVLEPKEVRDSVIEKIRMLNEKYGETIYQ